MDEYDSEEEEMSIRPKNYRPDDADLRSDYDDSDGDSYGDMDEAIGTADYDYLRSEYKFEFSSASHSNPILGYPAMPS